MFTLNSNARQIVVSYRTLAVEIDISERDQAIKVLELFNESLKRHTPLLQLTNGDYIAYNMTRFKAILVGKQPNGMPMGGDVSIPVNDEDIAQLVIELNEYIAKLE